MGSDEKRLNIDGLVPGEKYAIQVRAVDNGAPSEWSQKYHIQTIDDSAGGTRTPTPPALTSFVVDASGQYLATWNTVTTNTDGSPMVVHRYELELVSQYGTSIQQHYGGVGPIAGVQTRSFNFGALRSMFGGNIPTSITARLRVINSAQTDSPWSAPLTASLPVPNPPRNPASLGVVDGVKVTWDAPLDPIHLFGYRVYMSMTDENFIPDQLSRSNLVYEGGATEFTYTSLSYDLMHYFKIVSYSEPGLESTWVTTQAKPVSPYGPDDTPPPTPAITSLTLNADRSVSGQANIAWSIVENHPDNADLAGFVVAWKLTTDTLWRNTYFGPGTPTAPIRSGTIDLPRAFGNYDFKIAAYDFVGNYSAFSASQSLDGAGPAPLALTGVDGIPRWDGMRLVWNHSESSAVINGGRYEVQWRTSNSFPADTPIEYTTSNNFLDIAGLTPTQSTWWFRVRAVDVMNRPGPWSTATSKTLPAFPSGSNKDGVKPQTAPTALSTTGGVNYINVSWTGVVNADATNYEVYASVSSTGIDSINPDPAKLVAVTPATSLMVTKIPDAPNSGLMVLNTTYYFRIRAVDLDGAGPVSAQTSGQLSQIAAGNLGINMSGDNLLYNTSFEIDSDNNGVANFYDVVNGNTGVNPHTAIINGTTGRTGGLCQRVTWTGINATTKGITPSAGNVVVRPNTEYTLSFYAKAGTGAYPGTSAGSGFAVTSSAALTVAVEALANPTPSSTVWNRYIYKWTTGPTVDPNNFSISVSGHNSNGGWVEFDDIQLEAGNIASAYKTGTVSIAKLATGTMETATMTIATGGSIKSADYVDVATGKGFLLTGTGLNLLKGTVNADTLASNSSITNKLFVKNLLEMSNGSFIRSSGYRAPLTNGPTDLGAGYQISETSIDIRSGLVAAGALSAGTITSPDIKIGVGGKITVDSTGSIQSNNYLGPASPVPPAAGSETGWRISATGIELWDTNSKINVNALETSVLTSTTIGIGNGGAIQSSNWNTSDPVRWRLGFDQALNQNRLDMIGGTITGATIVTNQLKSAVSETVDGTTRYRFSIDSDGYAEFVGARVYGNMSVGNSTTNKVQSGNFDGEGGSNGWAIYGNGSAYFRNIQTKNLNIVANATVASGAGNYVETAGYSAGSYGWRISGDGTAEFNGGSFKVGSASWGQVWNRVGADEYGTIAQTRYYKPGNATDFSTVSLNAANNFELRGAFGGVVSMRPAWFTGRTHVVIGQDCYVTAGMRVDGAGGMGIEIENGGLWVKGGGATINGGIQSNGNLRVSGAHMYLDVLQQPANTYRRLLIGPDARFHTGAQETPSTIKKKKNVEVFDMDIRKILALEPKSFNFKWEDDDVKKSHGFIAEEAESLGLENWVEYDEDGEIMTFRYDNFTTAQHHVLRKQQDEIDELKAQVKQLLDRA